MQRGSFQLMKEMNQQIILKLIQKHEDISRAEIAEITDLSPATVSNIVKELIDMDLITETRRGKSSGGRKPILLEINPEGAYVIGLEWGISAVKAVLLNLNNDIVKYEEKIIDNFEVEHFIEMSKDLIDKFKVKIDNKEKIFGVGIGVHGLVDPEAGVSRYAPHFEWKNVKLKKLLEKQIRFPVLIDNDVRMMALTEKWEGRDNFIFINTGVGIGAAVVLDGKLYYGRDYSAGEFGHMNIVKDGPLCSCGDHGCLEALISTNNLIKRYYQGITSNMSFSESRGKWEELVAKAQAGENQARIILKEAGKNLGIGIANIINLLNPEAVVIGGDLVQAKDILFPVMKTKIKEKSLQIPGNNIQITSVSGGKTGAVGAGIMVLEELFKLTGGDLS